MLLREWVKTWYEVYKEPYLKYNSKQSIKYALDLYILPSLGSYDIQELRGIHIQALLNKMQDKANMRDKVRINLNDMLTSAYNNRYIDFNPMLAIKIKRHKKKKRKAMTVIQQQIFIDSLLGKKFEVLFLIYLFTGARRNEVITKDSFIVDFDKRLIYINGSKTDNAVRIVPLFNPLRKVLQGFDYKSYLTNYNPNNVTRIMHKHCNRIGLIGFCVHSLRNTFATRCLEKGINLKTIQAWLGHAELDTTANIYIDKNIFSDKDNQFLKSEIGKFNK